MADADANAGVDGNVNPDDDVHLNAVNIPDFVDMIDLPWAQQRRHHVGTLFRGLRMRGEGLYGSLIGQLTSFILCLRRDVIHLPVAISIVNDDSGQIDNILYEVMAGFGYKALYTLHEPGLYHIMIVIGDRPLPLIPIEVYDNINYVNDLRRSNSALLNRLQRKSIEAKEIADDKDRLIQEAWRTVRRLQTTLRSWEAAREATEVVADHLVAAVDQAINMTAPYPQVDSDIELSNSESDLDGVFGDNEDEGGNDDDDDEDDDDDRPQRPGSGRRQSPVFVFGGPSGEAEEPPLQDEPEQVENNGVHPENDQADDVRSPLRGPITKRNFWRMYFDDSSLSSDTENEQADRSPKRVRRASSAEDLVSNHSEELNIHNESLPSSECESNAGHSDNSGELEGRDVNRGGHEADPDAVADVVQDLVQALNQQVGQAAAQNPALAANQPPVPVLQPPIPIIQPPVPIIQAPVPIIQAPVPIIQAPVPIIQAPVPIIQPGAAQPGVQRNVRPRRRAAGRRRIQPARRTRNRRKGDMVLRPKTPVDYSPFYRLRVLEVSCFKFFYLQKVYPKKRTSEKS